jgi:hypothetical protein
MGRTLARLLVFSALFAAAPATGSAQVQKTEPRPYAAPAGKSLVVFKRIRRRQAEETEIRIIDQGGRCLGFLKNDWQVAAAVYPGTQMFLIVTGTAQATVQLVRAKLSTGKTYVVELRARVNVKSPVQVNVVRRENQPLEAFPDAIKEQSPFNFDARKCNEWVSWKRARIEPKAEIAKNKWDDAEADFRDQHTIRRNDGWTAAEVYGP